MGKMMNNSQVRNVFTLSAYEAGGVSTAIMRDVVQKFKHDPGSIDPEVLEAFMETALVKCDQLDALQAKAVDLLFTLEKEQVRSRNRKRAVRDLNKRVNTLYDGHKLEAAPTPKRAKVEAKA